MPKRKKWPNHVRTEVVNGLGSGEMATLSPGGEMGVYVRHCLTVQRSGKVPVRRSRLSNESTKFKKRMDLKFKSLLLSLSL